MAFRKYFSACSYFAFLKHNRPIPVFASTFPDHGEGLLPIGIGIKGWIMELVDPLACQKKLLIILNLCRFFWLRINLQALTLVEQQQVNKQPILFLQPK
jgi:hypothetical protein